jgi:mitochondrial splicing suppressor protein 51
MSSLDIAFITALRQTLHVPPGTPETEEQNINKPKARIFILGARKESSLPPHVWEQLCLLFPAGLVHLYFIGPQVALPQPPTVPLKTAVSDTPDATSPPTENPAEAKADSESPASPAQSESTSISEAASESEKDPAYTPNIYTPPTPKPIERQRRTRDSLTEYGVPSYTVPYTPQLYISGLQSSYLDVHPQLAETYDPYTDCFFIFHPGFGFPSPTSPGALQVAAPAEWGGVLPALLQTKCAIFVTGFSPADVERDVRSLESAPGVAGEFDWVLTPGPNEFGSEKWEVADFDPRVMVRSNWGVWGIRGKRTDVVERQSFASLFLGAPKEGKSSVY